MLLLKVLHAHAATPNLLSKKVRGPGQKGWGLGARLQGATVPGDDFVDTAQHLLDGVDGLEGEGFVSAVVAQVARGAQIAR